MVARLIDILAFGKFFTIFSFLFGLSFAIQMSHSTDSGHRFTLRFLWRLALLFAIGLVHGLFYSGDILAIYAILGVVLVACQKLSDRALVISGILLVLNTPVQIRRVAAYLNPPSAAEQEAQKQNFHQMLSTSARDFRIKRSGTLREVVEVNLTSGISMRVAFQLFTG